MKLESGSGVDLLALAAYAKPFVLAQLIFWMAYECKKHKRPRLDIYIW